MAKIEIKAFYPFEPELVRNALTDRESLNQWLMENDFTATVGHKFQFRTKPQGGWDGIVNCEVLQLKKPELLSYSWIGGGHRTIVTWNLEKTQGGTRLTLRHTGFRGVGGFVLSKFILGPGWGKMLPHPKRYADVVAAITVLLRYRAWLEGRFSASSSVNQELSALRRMFRAAASAGFVNREKAEDAARVDNAQTFGVRAGNLLTPEQARALLMAPDENTLKAKRDRALPGLLVGGGQWREELVSLNIDKIQLRDDRWGVPHLVGKR